MSRSFRIVAGGGWEHWKLGAEALAAGELQEKAWGEGVKAMFDQTQEVVHVVTGALKASGRWSVERSGMDLVGVVEYGGGGVDYAVEEAARGGPHDYMLRGYVAAEPMMEHAVGAALWESIAASFGV